MPPAFVLSQNQTLKLMYDRAAAGIRDAKTGISGSRSCTKSQLVYCVLRHTNGLAFTDLPEPRGSGRPGRRPHVPSSKPTMSKSRHASSPGSIGSGHRLYRPRRGAKRWRVPLGTAAVAGGAIYGRLPSSSTAFFAIFLQAVSVRLNPRKTEPTVPKNRPLRRLDPR
jgi:hypothetical protein